MFVREYFNGNRSSVLQVAFTTAIRAPAAFDEGGNFIRPRYGPLSLYFDDLPNGQPGTLFGDYHVTVGLPGYSAPAITYPALRRDYDNQCRLATLDGAEDSGADEVTITATCLA